MKIKPVLTCAAAIGFTLAAYAQAPASPQAQPAAGRGGRGGGQQPMPPGPNPNSQYRLGPDSLPQEGVPKGEIRGPFASRATSIPGRSTPIGSTCPRSTIPAVPASLMVFQDGQAFKDENGDLRTQNVMDNLIYRREIPVMIGVFINPGRRPDQVGTQPADRLGRRHHQSRHRVQHARRQVRPRDHRRTDARVEQGVQHLEGPRNSTASAGRVPAPSPLSPSRGSGPTSSAKC